MRAGPGHEPASRRNGKREVRETGKRRENSLRAQLSSRVIPPARFIVRVIKRDWTDEIRSTRMRGDPRGEEIFTGARSSTRASFTRLKTALRVHSSPREIIVVRYRPLPLSFSSFRQPPTPTLLTVHLAK